MRELLAEVTSALDRGRPCVFCSVVETRGSTPQKAGASMLVFADGTQAGTLGGGCVEAEVKRQALRVLTGEKNGDHAEMFTFCLDDNYGWDDGLICGGRMSILADSLAGTNGRAEKIQHYYRTFRQMVEAGQGCTEAVLTATKDEAPLGSRYLLDGAGKVIVQLGPDPLPGVVARNLTPLQDRPHAYLKESVAFLPVLPRITLLIVGAGHVGQAVAKLAADVDFDIWVLDDRASYVSSERFPTARRRLVGDIGQQLHDLQIGRNVYALIVTRGHGHDEEALFHLADKGAGYVGMIGSKRKIKLIFEDLIARGIARECLERVHAPLGFDIGSQTVPEIAVSIVAELIACRNLGRTIREARTWVTL